ncbi:extensin family protein [Methylobacterium nodulans]|uniref:Extensin family protein n=1 Tax=Methylobacterium nodulans (strain LMG 21967 / CNCM I-2342 / ORS 2060) TaxID=460265 RepID=B8IKU3_METNO|nr:extensin family protein [Methylobacterium nodulans]ACL56300.1 Extensin family protein [Methylobacterium nodulans ORS 2060]
MRRGLVAFSAFTLFSLGLTGCALRPFEQREPWRMQAEEACLARGLVKTSEDVTPIKEIDGPGVCGMVHPFRITRLAGGTVALKQRMTLACPIIPEVEAWLAGTVQPAAQLYFGQPVVEINSGSYACRGRNNHVGAKLSEHSFGNAVDVMSFRFADGTIVTVKGGWRGTEAEQGFLREVFLGACNHFTTVLAPGSDIYHYDHLHLDLARHDPRGLRRICKPLIKFQPQLPPPGAPLSPIRKKPPAWQPAPDPAPTDVEEDDPYGATPMSRREPASPNRVARSPASAASPAQAYAPRPAPPRGPATAELPQEPAPLPLTAPAWSSGPIY